MKNSLKIGLLALVIASTVVACDPPTANSAKTEIATTQKKVDTAQKAGIDTTKKDSVKKS